MSDVEEVFGVHVFEDVASVDLIELLLAEDARVRERLVQSERLERRYRNKLA